jgi:hypothetical protein
MSALRNDGLTDHLLSLNTVIKKSYHQAKKQLGDSVQFLHDEFMDLGRQGKAYFERMAQPINNFLKDGSEIELDFRKEVDRETIQFTAATPRGNVIPIDQALQGCMEENY